MLAHMRFLLISRLVLEALAELAQESSVLVFRRGLSYDCVFVGLSLPL